MLVGIALIMFTGGALEVVGYGAIVVVALLNFALERLTSGATEVPTPFGGEPPFGGSGVREPRGPFPVQGAGEVALPLTERSAESDAPRASRSPEHPQH